MDPTAGFQSLFGDLMGGSAGSGVGGYDTLYGGEGAQHGSAINIGMPGKDLGLVVAGIGVAFVGLVLVGVLLTRKKR